MLVLESALRQLLRSCNMESDYLVTEWEAKTFFSENIKLIFVGTL